MFHDPDDLTSPISLLVKTFLSKNDIFNSRIFTGIIDAESSRVARAFETSEQEVQKCQICFESVTHFLIDSGQVPS